MKTRTMMSLVFALAVLIIPCGLFAQPQLSTIETVKTTETVGTLSELSPDSIVVRTETNTTPLKYSSTKTTTYVDELGKPVAVETVKSGLPVTVYYTQDGNRLVANKVMIRRTTTTTTQ
ncbi:MAG: hypothetical protein ACD_75C00196G0005 [uncultured bacterium]|nr:MAG: hypothetical protein ACD_75C00196G0005 [uncultured bacterium]